MSDDMKIRCRYAFHPVKLTLNASSVLVLFFLLTWTHAELPGGWRLAACYFTLLLIHCLVDLLRNPRAYQ